MGSKRTRRRIKYENSVCGKLQNKKDKRSTRTVYVGSYRTRRRREVREQCMWEVVEQEREEGKGEEKYENSVC